MNRIRLLTTALGLAAAAATVGCDQCKKDLADCQNQYNQLRIKTEELQNSLSASNATAADLEGQLAEKTREIDRLKAAGTAKPPVGETKPPPGWQETSTGAKIAVGSDVLFSAGRATLSTGGKAKIRRIAGTIKSTYPGAQVKVYGFTDSDPIRQSARLWKDNLDLSANRAMAVTRALRGLGISAARIETVAMGATHFVASNTTTAGKARNRRVEIVVVRK